MSVRTVGRRRITLTLSNEAAVPITTTNLFATDFEVFFPTGNTGTNAYIGDSTVSTAWIPRTKGVAYNFVSGTGSLGGTIPEVGFNLAKFYVLGTALGDTCIIEYMYYDRS